VVVLDEDLSFELQVWHFFVLSFTSGKSRFLPSHPGALPPGEGETLSRVPVV